MIVKVTWMEIQDDKWGIVGESPVILSHRGVQEGVLASTIYYSQAVLLSRDDSFLRNKSD